LPRRRTHLVAGREPHSSLGQPLRDVWHRGRRPAHVVERRIAWAEQLGMKEAAALLNQTLEQEYNADRTLTEIAESSLNRQAAA